MDAFHEVSRILITPSEAIRALPCNPPDPIDVRAPRPGESLCRCGAALYSREERGEGICGWCSAQVRLGNPPRNPSLWESMPPTEGESRGRAGEDLGACDPLDDLLGIGTFSDDLAGAMEDWELPGPEMLTLRDYVAAQAEPFEALGSDAGRLIAFVLAKLADHVDFTCADTVPKFLDRAASVDLALAYPKALPAKA